MVSILEEFTGKTPIGVDASDNKKNPSSRKPLRKLSELFDNKPENFCLEVRSFREESRGNKKDTSI